MTVYRFADCSEYYVEAAGNELYNNKKNWAHIFKYKHIIFFFNNHNLFCENENEVAYHLLHHRLLSLEICGNQALIPLERT